MTSHRFGVRNGLARTRSPRITPGRMSFASPNFQQDKQMPATCFSPEASAEVEIATLPPQYWQLPSRCEPRIVGAMAPVGMTYALCVTTVRNTALIRLMRTLPPTQRTATPADLGHKVRN